MKTKQELESERMHVNRFQANPISAEQVLPKFLRDIFAVSSRKDCKFKRFKPFGNEACP